MPDVWVMNQQGKVLSYAWVEADQVVSDTVKAGSGCGNNLSHIRLFLLFGNCCLQKGSENLEAKCCTSDRLASNKATW